MGLKGALVNHYGIKLDSAQNMGSVCEPQWLPYYCRQGTYALSHKTKIICRPYWICLGLIRQCFGGQIAYLNRPQPDGLRQITSFGIQVGCVDVITRGMPCHSLAPNNRLV